MIWAVWCMLLVRVPAGSLRMPRIALPYCDIFLPLTYLSVGWNSRNLEINGAFYHQPNPGRLSWENIRNSNTHLPNLPTSCFSRLPFVNFLPPQKVRILVPPFKNAGLGWRQKPIANQVPKFSFVLGCFITGYLCVCVWLCVCVLKVLLLSKLYTQHRVRSQNPKMKSLMLYQPGATPFTTEFYLWYYIHPSLLVLFCF